MTKKPNQELVKKYHTRGLEHSKNGDHELAIENYTKAIELKPDYADAYYNRGKAYLRLGERKKAKSDIANCQSIWEAISITAIDEDTTRL